MFASTSVDDAVRIFHLSQASVDPLLGLHLKRVCHSRRWTYRTHPMDGMAGLSLGPKDIVVLDFFARPTHHAAIRNALEHVLERAEAAFLLVFPRAFSSSISPLRGLSSEYCFLGLDGVEEITLRIDLVRARTEQLNQACDVLL